MLDKLSQEEFNEIATVNDMARHEDEETKKFFERLRDKYGLILKEDTKREIEFTKARDALAERYRLEGKDDKARDVMNLRYGTFNDVAIKQSKKDAKTIGFINHNYKRYSEILRNRQAQELDPTVELPPLDSVVLHNHFTLADMKRLSTMIEPVDSEVDYLDAEHLRYWPDYRRSLAFAEYARFAKEIGIHQKLQKVFSMPLGVNDITLAEISTAYQTLLTGKVFKCLDGDWTDPCFIKEIKNRDGKVIFRNKSESKVVIGDTITSQMAVMLHSVFVNGTARSQYTHITATSPDKAITLRYPALGKTGTTNDYRNVAFLGALPTYVNEKNGIATDSVVAIGSYVGFDDNKPLKSGRTRIAGASGGLPQWADFAKKEIDILGLPEKIDFLDISMLAAGEVPLVLPNERGQLTVDPMTGSVIAGGSAEQGRPLPWIEVPGFTPPQTAAENGIMVSLPMPAAPAEPAATDSAAQPTATTVPATETAQAAPSTEQPTAQAAAPAQPAQPAQPKAAAMPKDDDWDLPEGFDSKNAFVPIEAE